MKKLSDKQQLMLAFIEEFIDDHDYPPTIRDIQAGCDITSTSVVSYNLDRLKELGIINRHSEVSRGLSLSNHRSSAHSPINIETVAVPLLGTIAAGSPFPMPEKQQNSQSQLPGLGINSFQHYPHQYGDQRRLNHKNPQPFCG